MHKNLTNFKRHLSKVLKTKLRIIDAILKNAFKIMFFKDPLKSKPTVHR